MITTWTQLIRAFGGPAAFARAIDISDVTARKMSSRNNVHSQYWGKIVARAPQAGVEGITLELLVSLRSGRDAKLLRSIMA